MTWGKVDDKLHGHPKAAQAGLEAMGLWVLALSWSGSYLTNGFIPEEQIARLGGDDGQATSLVVAGLWDTAEGGYQFHDYLDYNPSRQKVLETREARALAGRLGGQRSGEARVQASEEQETEEEEAKPKQNRSKVSSKIEAKTNPVPVPVPMPDPETATEERPPSADADASKHPTTQREKLPEQPQSEKQLTPAQKMFTALAVLCQIDLATLTKAQRGTLNQSEAILRRAEVRPADLGEAKADVGRTFAAWWYACDWRGDGKNGRSVNPPKPAQVREELGKWRAWQGREKARYSLAVGPAAATVETTDNELLWHEIQERLRLRMAQATFQTNFARSEVVGRDDGTLIVRLEMSGAAERVAARLQEQVAECAERCEAGLELRFVEDER